MSGYDVVIVGGAVIGSSIAYHLAVNSDFNGRVLVVEKDPSYQRCASALSAASNRQQFSTAINIEISLYGIQFLREAGVRLAVDNKQPNIQLREDGYLFLASENGREGLAKNHALQLRFGADILFLQQSELHERYPWLNVQGLAAGSLGRSGEGWFDGYALMQAFRRKARALGVTYRAARATDFVRENDRVIAVRLDDGTQISCGTAINAAGTGGAALAQSVGLNLPIHSKKRMIFTFECRETIPHCPLLIDPSGVYVRPEGKGFICSATPPRYKDPDSDDFDVDYAFFDEFLWPTLAIRVPAFEQIKVGRAWAGHYDLNLFDHNAFIGRAPGLDNFYLVNGFSGHGLQQSPAIGRGISELVLYGTYQTLDLRPLGIERLIENAPLIERNIV
jgi:FAD-dependent oxidoreductase domain-containing protein 1